MKSCRASSSSLQVQYWPEQDLGSKSMVGPQGYSPCHPDGYTLPPDAPSLVRPSTAQDEQGVGKRSM